MIDDRILAREALTQGSRTVGYDNELCTVTFNNQKLHRNADRRRRAQAHSDTQLSVTSPLW